MSLMTREIAVDIRNLQESFLKCPAADKHRPLQGIINAALGDNFLQYPI